MSRTRPLTPLISLVVPVLNEERCVAEFLERSSAALAQATPHFEIIMVDDGSTDGTRQAIESLREEHPELKAIHFTRNFGHQAALMAGLEFATGDAVVTLDGDLQHPPEKIPEMIEAWKAGADVVQCRRLDAGGHPHRVKDGTSQLFYKIMNSISTVQLAPAGADFRLIDRRVAEELKRLEEHFTFVRGLVPWMGFREAQIDYQVEERFAGATKYSPFRMFALAFDGIFSFSSFPLRLISLLGLFTTLFGIAFGIFWLVSYMLGHVEGSGWTSLVILVLIFGGVQLLSIGIASEYIGRIYDEVKKRPRFIVESTQGLDES